MPLRPISYDHPIRASQWLLHWEREGLIPGEDDLPHNTDEPAASDLHDEQMHLLSNTLDAGMRASGRGDVYVAGNRGLYFSLEQAAAELEYQLQLALFADRPPEEHPPPPKHRFRAPDVMAMVGVEDPQRPRLSWVMWEEDDIGPTVVVELLSDSTADVDYGEKKRIYQDVVRVPTYILYDPIRRILLGYALDDQGRYRRLQPDDDGDLPVAGLDIVVGIRPTDYKGTTVPMLRWLWPDKTALPTGFERAEVERQRAETAEAEREVETQRAEKAETDWEAEKQRAEAEKQRAEALEAEIAALRAQLASKSGEG